MQKRLMNADRFFAAQSRNRIAAYFRKDRWFFQKELGNYDFLGRNLNSSRNATDESSRRILERTRSRAS